MSKEERFEIFNEDGKWVIKDNEQLPHLLDLYKSCVRLNEFVNKIADLEAKLAEMEKCAENNKKVALLVSAEHNAKIEKLEQQLAEKDKEIKELLNYDRCSHCSYGQANKEYREKCSELIEELAEVKNSCDYYMNRANDLLLKDQDKISFCIERLKKVKEHFINIKTPTLGVIRRSEMVMYIDNQIKQLNESNLIPLGDKGEI